MVFNRYRFKILFGIIAIVFLSFIMVFQIITTKNYYTIGGACLLLVLITFWLFYIFDKRSRDLRNVIIRLKEGDFSYKLVKENHADDKDLAVLIENINLVIRNTRYDSQSRLEYLNRVVEQVDIGLMAITEKGIVSMVNPTTLRILRINHLTRIDQIQTLFPDFFRTIIDIKPQESSVAFIIVGDEEKRLMVRVSVFTIQEELVRLISFQNIKEELDRSEVESWQKLIRVLTHEITNSVTPIVTTCQGMIKEIPDNVENDREKRFVKGIAIIEQRSNRLIDFVKKFRSFSLIPEIKPEWIDPNTLVEGVINLFAEESRDFRVQVSINREAKNVQVNVDSGLIQQVAINLFRNALQSLNGIENPRIETSIQLVDQSKLMIRITDNGCGIKPHLLDKVFVPFFTTRKEGSGIGLSFSRQIMQLHGGAITLNLNEGAGTSVAITFPENRIRVILEKS